MTYNVFGGTLNLAQLQLNPTLQYHLQFVLSCIENSAAERNALRLKCNTVQQQQQQQQHL